VSRTGLRGEFRDGDVRAASYHIEDRLPALLDWTGRQAAGDQII
jgi:hypothetical protein